MPETMANFESALPGLHLGCRLSWYPTANPGEIMDEFYHRFYGAAADLMRAYWETIDRAWTDSPEHAGCGFGHLRRFTPATMKVAREALDKAAAKAKTDVEKKRVQMANDSFTEFELFMKMRTDLAEGRFANLEVDSALWQTNWIGLTAKYQPQYAFSPYGNNYFGQFFAPAYRDAARLAREFIVQPPLKPWRYQVNKEKLGETVGWQKPDLDDTVWPTTDPAIDTWADLGLWDCYGQVWYRTTVKTPVVPAGKKVYLWISSTDGSAKVFVNGNHVPYINAKGETNEVFGGYCQPASFDITPALGPGTNTQLSILTTRLALNELGTGGLLGPVTIYHEK